MRIGWNSTDLQGVSRQTTDSPSSKAKPGNIVSPESWDTLSEDTVNISSLAARAMESPDVRQEKVDALHEQVGTGRYQLDPAAIAEAMLK
jgi:flagellar biosynthesis anti-sigma factor FlgM